LQSTKTGRPPTARIASGVAMKVFEGHSTGLPAHARELERRQRASGPRPGRDGTRAVPGAPRRLEATRHLALGPLLGVDHLVPERVEARTVAPIEADGEARELLCAGGQDARKLAGGTLASSWDRGSAHSAGAMSPVS
jgi:hypothetical protein